MLHEAPVRETKAPDGGSATVLLAHEDNVLRTSIAMILTLRAGLGVIEADSRVEAAGVEASLAATLVDLDCSGWDGPSLVRELLDIAPEVPVIGLTADPETRALALEAGARDVLLASTPSSRFVSAVRVLMLRLVSLRAEGT